MTTPWPDLLRLAACELRIPPEAFWRLSLAEWRALTTPAALETLSRRRFDALAANHPD
jgi:uncharacterized phage protein (TIGR02216 family)